MLCEYGCGNSANYQLKNKKYCCSKSRNSCPKSREKNSEGTKRAYQSGKKDPMKLIYKNLPESTKKRMSWSKGRTLKKFDEVFCENSKSSTGGAKSIILRENYLEHKCAFCGVTEWMGKPIVLELDHINGVGNDHRLINLRFLCPNCHSQTSTFKGRNKKRMVVSDEILINALRETENVRQALIKAGLTPKGGNYARAYKLLYKLKTEDS